ncbi:hypothetical protein PENSPDRAFT_695174 [Peniophora sp. CONT]|nr:hypothetical protein PENSPDRAFT_695174 [Peniophora sp. CONT]
MAEVSGNSDVEKPLSGTSTATVATGPHFPSRARANSIAPAAGPPEIPVDPSVMPFGKMGKETRRLDPVEEEETVVGEEEMDIEEDGDEMQRIRQIKQEEGREPSPIRVPYDGEVIDLTFENVRKLTQAFVNSRSLRLRKVDIPYTTIAHMLQAFMNDEGAWTNKKRCERLIYTFTVDDEGKDVSVGARWIPSKPRTPEAMVAGSSRDGQNAT